MSLTKIREYLWKRTLPAGSTVITARLHRQRLIVSNNKQVSEYHVESNIDAVHALADHVVLAFYIPQLMRQAFLMLDKNLSATIVNPDRTINAEFIGDMKRIKDVGAFVSDVKGNYLWVSM